MLSRRYSYQAFKVCSLGRLLLLALAIVTWGSSFAQAVTLRYGDIVALYYARDATTGSLGPQLEMLVRIDPATGQHERIAILGFDEPFLSKGGLAQGADGSIFLTDMWQARVTRFDTETGEYTIVSQAHWIAPEPHIGDGPSFNNPHRVEREPSGTLLVANSGGLLRVDPQTGGRSLVSGFAWSDPETDIGEGPYLSSPWGLALESPTTALALGNDGILRVDLISGDRELVSGPTRGAGPLGSNGFRDLLITRAGQFIAAADGADGDFLVRIDPLTGDRELIPGSDFGNTIPNIAELPSSQLVVTAGNGLYIFDPLTGERVFLPRPSSDVFGYYRDVMVYVPEPSAMLLALLGLAFAPLFARRRSQRKSMQVDRW